MSKKESIIAVVIIFITTIIVLIGTHLILVNQIELPNEEAKDYYVWVGKTSDGFLYIIDDVNSVNSFHKDDISSIEVYGKHTLYISNDDYVFDLANNGDRITIYLVEIDGFTFRAVRVGDINDKLKIDLE